MNRRNLRTNTGATGEGTGDQSQEGAQSERKGERWNEGQRSPRRPDNPIEALILTRQPEIPAGLLNRVRCTILGTQWGRDGGTGARANEIYR